MLSNESPTNLFRLLTCNKFDLESMDGVLMDHAWKFDQYMLNREAKDLEYLLTLVDGSHWSSQTKLIPRVKGGTLDAVKALIIICINLLMAQKKLSTAKEESKCTLVWKICQKV
jgi:hypothetical protein